jgi:hypothetical protein
MTTCPVCQARFVASGRGEREWLERHVVRSHGIQRMQLVAGWPAQPVADGSRTAA